MSTPAAAPDAPPDAAAVLAWLSALQDRLCAALEAPMAVPRSPKTPGSATAAAAVARA